MSAARTAARLRMTCTGDNPIRCPGRSSQRSEGGTLGRGRLVAGMRREVARRLRGLRISAAGRTAACQLLAFPPPWDASYGHGCTDLPPRVPAARRAGWSSPPVPLSLRERGNESPSIVPPLRMAERGTGGEDRVSLRRHLEGWARGRACHASHFPRSVTVTPVTTSIMRTRYFSGVSMPFRPMTPTRLQAKGWARVGRPGAHLLRRGAWYPVVRISSSHIVVLDVNRRNVPVDRRFLEIRYHPPDPWSVVRSQPPQIQPLGRLFPLTYAVCPACRHRQGFGTEVKDLTCERCKKHAGLAWDEMS